MFSCTIYGLKIDAVRVLNSVYMSTTTTVIGVAKSPEGNA